MTYNDVYVLAPTPSSPGQSGKLQALQVVGNTPKKKKDLHLEQNRIEHRTTTSSGWEQSQETKGSQECSRESWRFACQWMPLSGWHGLHWSFSMMHPVTFGGCLGFFLIAITTTLFAFNVVTSQSWLIGIEPCPRQNTWWHFHTGAGWSVGPTSFLSLSIVST